MAVAANTSHSRQHGIRNQVIVFALGAHFPDFIRIQFEQMLKAFLIAGKEDKKSQNKNAKRGGRGDIYVVARIGDNQPQQAIRGSGIEQSIHGHQADGYDKDIDDVKERFGQVG